MEDPKSAKLIIEVRDVSRWSLYWNKPRKAVLKSAGTPSGPSPNETGIKKKGHLIGRGSIAVSQLNSSPRNLWIELVFGGGRVNIDAQFNEFVDPRFHNSVKS